MKLMTNYHKHSAKFQARGNNRVFPLLNWSMISLNSVNSSLDDLRDVTIHGTDMMCHQCELTTSGTTG